MSCIREDYQANKGNPKSLFLVLSFRFSNYFALNKNSVIRLLGLPIRVLYRLFVEWILGVELPDKTKVGKGLMIYHGQGLVVNSNTVIGDHVMLRHNTTIGNKNKKGNCPIIGNNVDIGANCVLIGNIKIGNSVTVGAGSVVVKDISESVIVAGNPAKIIKHKNTKERIDETSNTKL